MMQLKKFDCAAQRYLRQVKIKHYVIHTAKMTLGATLITDLRARPARDFVVFKNSKLGAIGVHPKHRDGIAPNAKNLLLKRGRNVHQPGIMRKYITGLPYQRSRLV